MPTVNIFKKQDYTVVYARFTPEFVSELLDLIRDPENRSKTLSEPRFAQLCELSQKSIYNYLHKDRYPDSTALKKMGQFLGVYFVEDWDEHIDNGKILRLLKAQLEYAS